MKNEDMSAAEKKPRSSWIPTNPQYDPAKPMQIGGQAVLEGVMMRAPGSVATAVRRAGGSMVVQKLEYKSLGERYPICGKPILRGAIGLIEMLFIGIKSLNFSAEVAMADEDAKEAAESDSDTAKKKRSSSGTSQWALIGSVVFALAFGVLLFFVTPITVTTWMFDVEQHALEFNLVSGAIRLTLFLVYLAGISLMKDIKRLFQYHGAEHKAVFAFELNAELLPPSVLQQSRFHPRCGTSFLLIVMLVAILSFAFLDLLLIQWLGELTLPVRLLTHLPFIPFVGGLSYEIIRFSARHASTWWGKILIAPGLWLQGLTTREPDTSQVEVAILALQCAMGTVDATRYAWTKQQPENKAA